MFLKLHQQIFVLTAQRIVIVFLNIKKSRTKVNTWYFTGFQMFNLVQCLLFIVNRIVGTMVLVTSRVEAQLSAVDKEI
jgi:hypothetical protein